MHWNSVQDNGNCSFKKVSMCMDQSIMWSILELYDVQGHCIEAVKSFGKVEKRIGICSVYWCGWASVVEYLYDGLIST